jgi:hypothetical protein
VTNNSGHVASPGACRFLPSSVERPRVTSESISINEQFAASQSSVALYPSGGRPFGVILRILVGMAARHGLERGDIVEVRLTAQVISASPASWRPAGVPENAICVMLLHPRDGSHWVDVYLDPQYIVKRISA